MRKIIEVPLLIHTVYTSITSFMSTTISRWTNNRSSAFGLSSPVETHLSLFINLRAEFALSTVALLTGARNVMRSIAVKFGKRSIHNVMVSCFSVAVIVDYILSAYSCAVGQCAVMTDTGLGWLLYMNTTYCNSIQSVALCIDGVDWKHYNSPTFSNIAGSTLPLHFVKA